MQLQHHLLAYCHRVCLWASRVKRPYQSIEHYPFTWWLLSSVITAISGWALPIATTAGAKAVVCTGAQLAHLLQPPWRRARCWQRQCVAGQQPAPGHRLPCAGWWPAPGRRTRSCCPDPPQCSAISRSSACDREQGTCQSRAAYDVQDAHGCPPSSSHSEGGPEACTAAAPHNLE